MTRIAIFASGTGSNALKILEYFQSNNQVQIALIVSNRKDAPVLDIGKRFDVKTVVLNKKEFYQPHAVVEMLHNENIDFIVLAGFLWLIPEDLVIAFKNKIINIHPALLPKFGGKGMYGMHVHEAVKNAQETETGITIHFVNKHYDEGNIIFQASCLLEPTDTPQDIAQKVHQLEHKFFPIVIEEVLQRLQ